MTRNAPHYPLRAARLALALAAVALAAGCGKSTGPTQPAGPGTFADYQRLLLQSYLVGAVVPPNLDLAADILVTMDAGGVPAAAAAFRVGGGFADAGRVSVADQRPIAWGGGVDTLVRQSVPVNGVPYYAYSTVPAFPRLPSLVFDGVRTHWFDVSGSAALPAYGDSVQSVATPVVAAPAPGATVARSADLAVTWADAGADTTVYVVCNVRSMVDSTLVVASALVRDVAASATVPASRLGTLAAGSARVSVARYRLMHQMIGGRRVDIVCEATDVRSITLQ